MNYTDEQIDKFIASEGSYPCEEKCPICEAIMGELN